MALFIPAPCFCLPKQIKDSNKDLEGMEIFLLYRKARDNAPEGSPESGDCRRSVVWAQRYIIAQGPMCIYMSGFNQVECIIVTMKLKKIRLPMSMKERKKSFKQRKP
jgi:hypothetical protein